LAYNKTGNKTEAIKALGQAVTEAEAADNQQTIDIAFAAHRELARANVDANKYNDAVAEYQFLAANSSTDEEKAEANFWLGRIYDENLKDYANAAKHYETVVNLGASDIYIAQSLYYLGLVYSGQLKDGDSALAAFQELVDKYSGSEDANITAMVTDANLRIPELLVNLGKFDDAVARARDVRDQSLQGSNKDEIINTQYQLAYLLGEQASKAADMGSPNPTLTREAAMEYGKVYEYGKPVNQASKEIKDLVAASLYNAGYLLYELGEYDDYKNALVYFKAFTDAFPKSNEYYAALEYLGFGSFEMARLKADLNQFDIAGQYFLRFAKEFPDKKDAPMIQFQAAEAFYRVRAETE